MNLRPAVLDHLGLVAALEQYTNGLQNEQLVVNFKAIGFDDRRLPPDTETALYRIVQEALTNVRRHSQASSAGVLLEWCKAGRVRVFIEDDGTGFVPVADDFPQRIGLIGMRERAEMLAGSLTIESSPGKGTSIIVEVPDGYSYSDR
jgi:signal transduction histidine kinase